MSSAYQRKSERSQPTPEELDAYYLRKAAEREKRGFVGFTREKREEELQNRTPGQNTAHDVAQKARERRGGSR